jgi:hypothetical protein
MSCGAEYRTHAVNRKAIIWAVMSHIAESLDTRSR